MESKSWQILNTNISSIKGETGSVWNNLIVKFAN